VRTFPSDKWIDIKIGDVWLILTKKQAETLKKEIGGGLSDS